MFEVMCSMARLNLLAWVLDPSPPSGAAAYSNLFLPKPTGGINLLLRSCNAQRCN
jgi:hypothetical protein